MKEHLVNLFIAAAIVIIVSSMASAEATNLVINGAYEGEGLMLHFDESSGTSTADASSNYNDGTLNNMSDADWISGQYGNALDFDGVNDYVSVSDDPSLDLTDTLIIDVWVYQHARIGSGSARIVRKGPSYDLGILSTGTVNLWVRVNGTDKRTDSSDTIPLNTWTHILAEYSASDPNHKAHIYINDVEVSYDQQQATGSPYTLDTNTNALNVGAYVSGGKHFDGLIDELCVTGISSSDDGSTVAIWHFDESSGSTAADSSSNGNDATLYNMDASDWVTGYSGNCLDFDGSNDYAWKVDNDSLDVLTGIEIGAWVYQHTRSASGSERIVRKGSAYDLGVLPSGNLSFWIRCGGVSYRTDSTDTIPLNTWTHVKVVYSDVDALHRPTMYINGSEVSAYDQRDIVASPFTIDANATGLSIGAYVGSKYFDGLIDELVIAERGFSNDASPPSWHSMVVTGSPTFDWLYTAPHTGDRYVEVYSPSTSSRGAWRQTIDVSSNTNYVVSTYYKQAAPDRQANVDFLGETWRLARNSSWTEFRRLVNSGATSGFSNLDLSYKATDYGSNTMWFDDAAVEVAYVNAISPSGETVTDNTPTFEWESNYGTDFFSYTMECSTDSAFSTGVTTVDELRNTSYASSDTMANGTWYWRVIAYGYSEWTNTPVCDTSSIASFVISNGGTDSTDPAISTYTTRLTATLPANIEVVYSDQATITSDSVTFKINGTDKTSSCTITSTKLEYPLTESYTQFSKVYVYDTSTSSYSDYTTAAANATDTVPFAEGAGDMLYIGKAEPFKAVVLDLSTSADLSIDLDVDYWDGSGWLNVSGMTDCTRDMRADGTIIFALPDDWTTTSVNGESAYWIRVTNSLVDTNSPVALSLNSKIFKAEITINDGDDNSTTQEWHFAAKAAPGSGQVTLSDTEQTISIDSTEFFPIGMFRARIDDLYDTDLASLYTELAAAGFNTVQAYNQGNHNVMPVLNEANSHSLKLIAVEHDNHYYFSMADYDLDTLLDGVRASTFDLMNYPALLAYYMGDEVDVKGMTPRILEAVYEAVQDIDPYHMMYVIVGADGALAYKGSVDMMSSDVYPVPDVKITRVSEEVDAMVAAVGDEKHISYVVQMFQKLTRWPTIEEIRNMTYQAIVHGAKGVAYYCYFGDSGTLRIKRTNPDLWSSMKDLASELNDMSSVFLDDDSTSAITCDESTIDLLLKTSGGKDYLMAVNRDYTFVDSECTGVPHSGVTFTSDTAMDTVTAIHESGGDRNRTIGGSGYTFTDDFDTFTVRIYEITYQ
jgi:Concanavalin A-like lectin/glucanases superfamily